MKMRKGFTLIELLIVLAIIAALMGVVTPIALNAVKRARVTKVAENLRNIKAAVESYIYTENKLEDSDPDTDVIEGFNITTLVNAGYLGNADNLTSYNLEAVKNTGGSITVTVYYSGDDVTADDLDDVLPGAKSVTLTDGTTAIGLVFDVEQWW